MSTTTQTHGEGDEQAAKSLFAVHEKVYPKSVAGKYRKLKWTALVVLLAIYYIVPWLRWDRGPTAPDQAVLVDLAGPAPLFLLHRDLAAGSLLPDRPADHGRRRAVPGDLAGRTASGAAIACPQTVWTDLFMSGRALDRGRPGGADPLRQGAVEPAERSCKRSAKHAAWLLIAFLTGGAWVMYFPDAPTVVGESRHRSRLDESSLSSSVLFTATTYLLAGLAREQVCTYMCPWPRIQGAMVDEDTMAVTYESWRGEPRGREAQGRRASTGGGDCIDCKACVAVCPTGIDIRDGFQLECIGCGLCVDACNEVMAKIGRPLNLIAYDSQRNQGARSHGATARVPAGPAAHDHLRG